MKEATSVEAHIKKMKDLMTFKLAAIDAPKLKIKLLHY